MIRRLPSPGLLLVGLAALCSAVCGGCALGLVPLSADPIDSQVVDADTGAPIEGAVVVAYWEIHQGSLGGDASPCGAANVEEAVTDKDGKFHISGWGPTMAGCRGEMRQGNPELYVFKSGYRHLQVPNDWTSTSSVMTTHSGWTGRQMKLKKFPDINYHDIGPHTYYGDFSELDIGLSGFVVEMPTQCNWKKIPSMLRAFELERRRFLIGGYPVDGVTAQLIDDNQWFLKLAPQCGSPKEFMEGLMK